MDVYILKTGSISVYQYYLPLYTNFQNSIKYSKDSSSRGSFCNVWCEIHIPSERMYNQK